MTPRQRLSSWARSEGLQATLVLLLELVLFFWTPLSRYDEVYYSSADLTQAFSLTRVEPGHQPGNQLQSDAVTQMQPWFMFNREELAAGRLPLWNPWNGNGCPHFANYQSAVFSPFSVPFYVLGFKAALLLSAAMKLFALGIFTWLFLREIGVRHVAALVGATIFMFAGHNTLLLYFPHVGAMVALPAAMYFVAVALRRFERAQAERVRPSLRGPLAGVTIALLVGLLAGNPEPFYFAMILVAVYCAARLIGMWLRTKDRDARRGILKLCGKLVFAGAIAGGLAAFQVLPFFEYLNESRVLEQRTMRQTPLGYRWWSLMLFPDALGNPGSPYKISENVPPPNYELVNMAYVGGTAILLALVSFVFARRDRRVLFFSIAGAVWLVYAYDLFGAADVFMRLPTLDRAPMNRSQGVWNFIVACSAALCVENLWQRAGRRAWLGGAGIVVLALAGLVACLVHVDKLIAYFASYDSPNHKLFLDYVPAHIRQMSVLLLATAALAALLLLARTRIVRTLAALCIGACCFASTGWLLRNYNPVAENRFFFPETTAIQTLKGIAGKERIAILGQDLIPPDSNMAYHVSVVSNYDGMWVRDYDHLYRDHFGDSNNWRPILKGSKQSLQILGVQYVLAKWGWNFLDNGLREFGKGPNLVPVRQEILPNREVTQTFRSRDKDMQAVMVVLSTFPKQRPCTLHVVLEDLYNHRLLVDVKLTSAEIQSTVYSNRHTTWPGEFQLNPTGRPVVFRFEKQPLSFLRHYKLILRCEDGLGGDTICAWSMPVSGYSEGEATYGKKKLAGELLFDWSYHGPDVFEPVAQLEELTLYRFKEAMPEFSIVSEPIVVPDHQAALDALRVPHFDPRKTVVLEASADKPLNPQLRRVVQFSDSDWCYLVAPDGKTLAHIDDETTFLANELRWNQIEKLPAEERAKFTVIPDSDRAAKRAAGLRLIEPGAKIGAPPEVLEQTPTRSLLRISRLQTGYLVWTQAHFPGWVVRLNGEEKPLLRANYAFNAVEIPPGDWQVELSYEPQSLRAGVWIGVGSLVMGLASLLLGRRKRSA